jgi:hypothetical protein
MKKGPTMGAATPRNACPIALDKLVTRRLCLFTLNAAFILCALTSLPAASQAPPPPESPCFEIAFPAPGNLRTGPILLNKCTGATHILTRVDRGKGGVTYEWVPIVTRSPPDASARAGRKCFAFDGRQFCP